MSDILRTARVIALSVFRQGLRGRLLFLAVTAVLAVFLLGTLFRNFAPKANLELRLILETGLALSALLVLGSALILSCRGLGQGDDRASYDALFALPLSRDGVHLGHLIGIGLTLAAFTTAMAVAMAAVIAWRFALWRTALLVHFVTLFVEAVVLAAIASVLALGRSPIVAFFATLAIAIIAHAEGVVVHLAQESGATALEMVVRCAVSLLPSLGALDVKAAAVRDVPLQWTHLGWALSHSLLYLLVLVVVGSAVRRRMEAA